LKTTKTNETEQMAPVIDTLLGSVVVSLQLPAAIVIASCIALAAAFVGSLYVWTIWPFTLLQRKLESEQPIPSAYQRDHPLIILRRSLSLIFVSLVAPVFLAFLAVEKEQEEDYDKTIKTVAVIWRHLGIRLEGLLSAIALPFVLTHALFLGSHILNHLEGLNSVYCQPRYWSSCLGDAVWLRNIVVAPATEEFVFRGCIVPLLVPILGSGLTIAIAPLFFGFAHFHHIYEKLKTTRLTLAQILPPSFFQFLYTSVYGAYSVFLFLRTGHVTAPIIAHSVCNHLGFPNFGDIFLYRKRTQALLWAAFVVGLVAWVYLLFPLTDPAWFGNEGWTDL